MLEANIFRCHCGILRRITHAGRGETDEDWRLLQLHITSHAHENELVPEKSFPVPCSRIGLKWPHRGAHHDEYEYKNIEYDRSGAMARVAV